MMTGTGEATIFSMISRVESTKPPGVLISITTASSLLAAAESSARPMYSAVTGWIASSTVMRKTSAEQKAVSKKSTAKAWRIHGCRGCRQLPSCARLGRARAPVPIVLLKADVMVVTAAALSPRAWLLRYALNPGRQDCRVRVAAPGLCSGRLLAFCFLLDRGAPGSGRHRRTHERGARPRLRHGLRAHLRERRNLRRGRCEARHSSDRPRQRDGIPLRLRC